MIDFRYHLVSIVSIFMALAVGIVLGAGPLQQEIGKTLTNQVSTLRKDKADLRTQLGDLQKQVDASDDFATSVTPSLVAARLGGRSVVLVRLPGADTASVDELIKVLRTSGATVSGQVAVEQGWTDPTKRSFRDQLVTSLGPLVGADDDASEPLEQRMGSLLAKALVVSQVSESLQPSPTAGQALSGLKDAGLLSFDGDGPAPATLAVVVAGTPDGKGTTDEQTAVLAGWSGIAQQLDASSSGAVVVGPPESATSGGLLDAVRSDDDVSKVASTVDDVATPMGRIATIYALRQQMTGKAGHYGVGTGASAVLPPLTDGS